MEYHIRKVETAPKLDADWDADAWGGAEAAEIANFLPDGSDHRPKTQVKLLHDGEAVFGMFKVDDHYVRSVSVEPQAQVCKDSCVEFFFRPKPDSGYFNFEFNCGGNVLCYYIEDHTRTENGFKKSEPLKIDDLSRVEIFHTMPKVVEPEITEPTTWRLCFRIPVAMLENYAGPIPIASGSRWLANFYKCGDHTSHPHWATWAPIAKKNFHLPEHFQPIIFA